MVVPPLDPSVMINLLNEYPIENDSVKLIFGGSLALGVVEWYAIDLYNHLKKKYYRYKTQ